MMIGQGSDLCVKPLISSLANQPTRLSSRERGSSCRASTNTVDRITRGCDRAVDRFRPYGQGMMFVFDALPTVANVAVALRELEADDATAIGRQGSDQKIHVELGN